MAFPLANTAISRAAVSCWKLLGSYKGIDRKFLLVRVRPGDRPRKRPYRGTGTQIGIRLGCPAPRGVGERASAAGHGVCAGGNHHTLILRTLKLPTDGNEHTVLPVGSDKDPVALKFP